MPPVNQHLLAKLRLQDKSQVDADGRVAGDAPCRGCGYNLRGIDAEGNCPECGQAIADSLRDDRPEHSDPRWLARVARGGNLCIASVITPVVLLFLLALLGLVGELVGFRGHGRLLYFYGLLPSLVLCHLLAVVAVWLVTLRDPARRHHAAENLLRWIARLGAVGWLPAALIVTEVFVVLHRLTGSLVLREMTGWVSILIPLAGVFASGISLLLYLHTLALRMAEWRLTRQIKTVFFGLLTSVLLILIAARLMLSAAGQRDHSFALLFLLGLGAALGLAFAIWAIVLIDQTRRALNQAYRHVRWDSEHEA